MTDKTDDILKFWNERAQHGEKAGTNDLPLKHVEMQVLSQYLRDGQSVLDIGCGNGVSAFHFADRMKLDLTGIDFAEGMIEDAKRTAAARGGAQPRFFVGDVRRLGAVQGIAGRKFDVVITERVLINLRTWEEQKAALREIVGLLAPGGAYLMCENLEEGLQNINAVRAGIGLPAIDKPWHNRYLREAELREVDFAQLAEYRDFTSAYYFLSRVVNAWVAKLGNSEPQYDSPINRLAGPLVGLRSLESAGLGQTRLWVWKRKEG